MKNAADSDFQICLPGSGCGCFQSMSDATSGSFNISLQLSPGILMGIKHDGKQEKYENTFTTNMFLEAGTHVLQIATHKHYHIIFRTPVFGICLWLLLVCLFCLTLLQQR